jgi:hypothetical protein
MFSGVLKKIPGETSLQFKKVGMQVQSYDIGSKVETNYGATSLFRIFHTLNI